MFTVRPGRYAEMKKSVKSSSWRIWRSRGSAWLLREETDTAECDGGGGGGGGDDDDADEKEDAIAAGGRLPSPCTGTLSRRARSRRSCG